MYIFAACKEPLFRETESADLEPTTMRRNSSQSLPSSAEIKPAAHSHSKLSMHCGTAPAVCEAGAQT